jgi:cytochrome bd ubiquinol oxidase subunit II
MIELIWYVMGLGLVAYAVTAGADFGGGVWDLLAAGSRREEHRRAVEKAIAPIWEANHVWLIFVIVILFTAFPVAFGAISTALHIPITLALIGIVLRGAAFTFRAYGLEPTKRREAWGRVFGWSSSITPIFLGMSVAAVSSGEIRVVEGEVRSSFLAGWLSSYAILTGLFTLVLFSMLAAVYLAADTEGAVQLDFRMRALAAELVAAILAALTFWRAEADAPLLFDRLARSPWTLPSQGITAIAAITAMYGLVKGKTQLARGAAAVQVALVVAGWGLAMDHHLLLPDLTLEASGSRPEVLEALAPTLAIGALILLPALAYLMRVFKASRE